MRYATAIAAMLLLTACASTTDAPKASPSTTHSASASDVGYLAAVRPSVQGSTDADLISLGKQSCAQLDAAKVDNQAAVLDVAQGLVDKGMSANAAASIVTAAIPAYCPQHKGELPTP